ncbi:MAG TPA: head GIN domain-containing protein [Puia sp.]|nr:head GIN domain-containing protein [Puia sp.]
MQYTGVLLIAAMGLIGRATAQQEQVRQVSGFDKVSTGGSFAVHLKINGTESLKIDGADAQELAKIETKVTSGQLEIRWMKGSEPHNYHGRIDVYVTAKSLSGLSNAGSGSMDVDGVVKGGSAEVDLSGSGSITAAVDAGKLDIVISGSGRTTLKGKASSTHIDIAGSGRLSADGLSTDVADAQISGSGDTYITVNKTISASIVGSGSVHYSGAATIGSVSTVGSGRLRRV